MIKAHTQDKDVRFPSPPSDGISSLSMNGSNQTNSTVLTAGCWDNSVYKLHSILIAIVLDWWYCMDA